MRAINYRNMGKTVGLLGLLILLIAGCVNMRDSESYHVETGMGSEFYCTKFNNAVEGPAPTLAAIGVIDDCIKNMNEEALTKYLLRYEALLLEKKAEFSNKIFNRGNHEVLYDYFEDSFDAKSIDKVSDPEFRSTLRDLVNSGYTLMKSENGIYQVVIDYNFFERYRGSIASEAMSYFDIMDMEQKKPLLGSEKILGTPQDLMERLLILDAYINENPKSERLKELSIKANDYLLTLVYGYFDEDPYEEDDKIRETYLETYKKLAGDGEETLMKSFIGGLVQALETSDGYWTDDVYDYMIDYPEIYRKRYLESSIYPDGFVDVGFGWTSDDYLYYYPVFTGITNRAEQGKLNLMGRSIVEKRMLGEGFAGMYTGGNYIWSDFELTFNRRNWISIKYDLYTELPDGTYYWSIESLNYDLHSKSKIQLNDVLKVGEERAIIDDAVKAFFEESRTYYAVSLEDFYKNPNPDFYLTNTGINILVPVNPNTETSERVVEIFIPFEKFRTSVEYIYKIPQAHR